MAEDTWLKTEREYFVSENKCNKEVNKALEKYNRFLQKALIGDSPFVAERIKQTLERAGNGIPKDR